MNIDQAVLKACEEPTLLDALNWICIWESERAIKQATEYQNSGIYIYIYIWEQMVQDGTLVLKPVCG